MQHFKQRLLLFFTLSLLALNASAGGGWGWQPAAVPIDSPWALGGLSLLLAIVGLRMIRNRKD